MPKKIPRKAVNDSLRDRVKITVQTTFKDTDRHLSESEIASLCKIVLDILECGVQSFATYDEITQEKLVASIAKWQSTTGAERTALMTGKKTIKKEIQSKFARNS